MNIISLYGIHENIHKSLKPHLNYCFGTNKRFDLLPIPIKPVTYKTPEIPLLNQILLPEKLQIINYTCRNQILLQRHKENFAKCNCKTSPFIENMNTCIPIRF